jgi:5-deoxy-glucuronate isomerase
VLIPEGYHPVVAAHGYDVYYLNALAGARVRWLLRTTGVRVGSRNLE